MRTSNPPLFKSRKYIGYLSAVVAPKHPITFPVLLACASLTACGGGVWDRMAPTARLAVLGAPDANIDYDKFRNSPYASMLGKIGKGGLSVLILGGYEGQNYIWYSADRAALVTRDGRVVKTAGFPANLRRLDLPGLDPVLGQAPARYRLSLDLEYHNLYGMPADCALDPLGPETVEIAGQTQILDLWQEQCRVDALSWTFTNLYWRAPQSGASRPGAIVKSVQHYMPGIPPLELSILKPAG